SMTTDTALTPIPASELLTLKATAIDDYLTCPLKYKFVHILRVPVLRHHAAVYGNAIHEALKAYHQRKLSGQTMTEAELLQAFKDHWISEGFVSREHEEQRFRQGQETLRRYLQAKEAEGFVPQSAEEEFRLRLDQVQVIGRWDCVVERDSEVTIVDFKTSDTVRKQEDADRRVKESLQLLIYALGYQAKYGRLPDAVELHFLEPGLIGHWEPGPRHLEKAKAQVHEADAAIRTRQFPAKPSYFTCTYCAYQNICPAALTL
ncbi:MAG: PD-(D/E)XK nuclease family protein, partial [Elusimicrobia bacterium]|nr:PD-(D/E)XK nuclease family protein [Elusimicrobiota bacterium]